MLVKASQKVLDRPVEIIGSASGNDGRFSQYFDMAVVCTGPVANHIHGLDENVEILSAILLFFIRDFAIGRYGPLKIDWLTVLAIRKV